jgi:predicted nucleic-acid-binding protein
MAALDTNLLVRWLVADDAGQVQVIERLLTEAAQGGQRFWVPVTVLLEVEWVLRSRYGFDKTAITHALDALLSTTELDFQEESAVEQALWHFRAATTTDFADALHVAMSASAGRGPLLTLDKKAARLAGAQWVE